MERGSSFHNGVNGAAAAAATAAAGAGAGNSVPEPRSTLDIVQQRFKADETVHMIFEAYQIKGQEHVEGLLALVSSASGGTYAIISFTLRRTPLTASHELKINKVFPINTTFKLVKDAKGSITESQFDLSSSDDERPSKYYYHPIKTDMTAVDYAEFVAKVYACQHAELPSDTMSNHKWLDDYREIGEVKQELKKRESQYIVYKDIIIYCATWNVNNRPCGENDNSLRSWLVNGERSPDIYAIGLQELDSTVKAMYNANQTNISANQWISKLLMNLQVDDGPVYEVLQSVRLSGILLVVIVRKRIRKHIIHCCKGSVARGIFNAFGNKGGVGVSLQLNEASICFVNSHLAANMDKVAERNEDYRAIEEGMRFDDSKKMISDHDHIFWMGDLNYRISNTGPVLPGQDTYDLRLQRDQLRMEMTYERCFKGYTEGEIMFPYTYKYDINTDNFDSSEKKRDPAYCDRVLWKGNHIKQLAYDCVMQIRASDHKPVFAIFSTKIKTRDEAKYKRVQEEVLKAVDKRENDNQPQLVVDKTAIDLGVVRFNEPAKHDFYVYNNCPQQVDFSFKEKPGSDICEKFLQVDPRSDSLTILSGCPISVKMLVDSNCVTDLLKKLCGKMEKNIVDILILDVTSGRDIFITVHAVYQPSCFGLSMETMCRTDRPLCEYKQEEIIKMMTDVSPEYRVTMPREFFLLIDYLHKQGDKLKGIFQNYNRNNPLSSRFNAVRDWLDTWSDAEFPGTPQTAAEALLLLLDLPEQALLEPFVDDLLHTKTKSEAMDFIDLLSPPKRNVFMHLCMFLREGVERGHYDLNIVASIFGRILLPSMKYERTQGYQGRKIEFMCRFIHVESSDTVAAGHGHGGSTGPSLQT